MLACAAVFTYTVLVMSDGSTRRANHVGEVVGVVINREIDSAGGVELMEYTRLLKGRQMIGRSSWHGR
jgi:hypothetical protein